MASLPRLLSFDEAAAVLDPNGSIGITARTIDRYVREGRLPKLRLGRRPAVREDHLTELLEKEEQWFKSTNPGNGRTTAPASSEDTSTGGSTKSRQTQRTRAALSRLGIGSPGKSGNVKSLDAARRKHSAK